MIFPLDNKILKDWFLKRFDSAPFFESDDFFVSTMGSKPFAEVAFDDFLRAGDLDVFYIHPKTNILIIGQENWSKEKLDNLLDRRVGMELKVYSQEMFWAYWITEEDPFDDKEVALAFAEGHPALEYLLSCWVDWVNTNVPINYRGGDLLLDGSPEKGVLKALGYTVGKTKGLHFSKRRKILAEIFNSNLEDILSPEYIKYCKINYPQYLAKWGNAKSERRLIKMRDFLSTNCKMQKGRGNIEAASDYDEDLEWLRIKFYKGRFRFNWLNYHID